MTAVKQPGFLPMSREEMRRLGWTELDVILVSGDAYVDHPSFGAALLGRWLVANGFRVGIVAQPRWDKPDDIARLGRPRLFIGVTAGAMDSMLAHYTAFRKKRSDDAYTPGGRAGARPNRACIAYTSLARHAFPGVPVVIGGIEASMRRASHYDFWTDSIRRSLLLDSKADILAYGMAERAVLEIAKRIENGPGIADLRGIAGTVFAAKGAADTPEGSSPLNLPAHEDIAAEPRLLMTATLVLEQQALHDGPWLAQSAQGRTILLAPPATALTAEELDHLYSLPFARRSHPSYKQPVPALDMIQFSVTAHRGCAGGCSFCALALHQGRRISSRSRNSILAEIAAFREHPDWHGSVTNLGGPSANMWDARCTADPSKCRRVSCLWPGICTRFKHNQRGLIDLMRAVSRLPGVKHVRAASGVRHDLALADPDYMRAIAGEFTGGQLTVAPEHIAGGVLDLMRKPKFDLFERFLETFEELSRKAGKEQYLLPYLISAFPGCTDEDMRALGRWLKQRHWRPQQVQCFIPTPGTVASAMYFAGVDAEGRKIHVARTDAERLRQHGMLVPPRGR